MLKNLQGWFKSVLKIHVSNEYFRDFFDGFWGENINEKNAEKSFNYRK